MKSTCVLGAIITDFFKCIRLYVIHVLREMTKDGNLENMDILKARFGKRREW